MTDERIRELQAKLEAETSWWVDEDGEVICTPEEILYLINLQKALRWAALPRHWRVRPRRRPRVESKVLARAQAQLDDTVRGTKAELDARARSVFAQWTPARRRAARSTWLS